MSTEHARLSARLRHPSAGSTLWTSVELSAPVEAIWMLELAEQVACIPDDDPIPEEWDEYGDERPDDWDFDGTEVHPEP